MIRGVQAAKPFTGAFAAVVFIFISGCAVNPLSSASTADGDIVTERDMLAEAARAVETAPWPKPQSVSFVSRLTGAAEDDRVTKSDAAEIYAVALQPAGDRFAGLEADAMTNLAAADRLVSVAEHALSAPRLTSNDVAVVENAIQALRENRQIYVSAAHEIEKLGERVDDSALEAIRGSYTNAIRALGETADDLAERLDHDQSETYASPARRPQVHNLSGV